MMRMRLASFRAVALACGLSAASVGGALPGARDVAQFRRALPGYRWNFPADHFAHPAFANEWWYFTGNVDDANGRRFGFELTFFRVSPFPGATLADDVYFAHFALTDIRGGKFFFHERARRGAWREAGVDASAGSIWNENWRLAMGASGPTHLHARWGDHGLDLALHPGAAPLLNGAGGWSQKGAAAGEASYYYSLPRLPADGQLTFAGASYKVAGAVWMDHEFGSAQLAPGQRGWDWMGLQLDCGSGPPLDLMMFDIRDADGSRDPHSAGSVRVESAQLSDATFTASAFEMRPLRTWTSSDGGRYPVEWEVVVRLPAAAGASGRRIRQLRLHVTAALDDQELRAREIGVDYWEGAVSVSGDCDGSPVHGRGYLEMTGYTHPFEAAKLAQ
jgi:predicted secreted hydrolase